MPELVTDEDLSRARCDAAFRHQMLADHLGRLLTALKDMRKAEDSGPDSARQMREGVDLAVKLANRLQEEISGEDPEAA